jgi:hypothetical protein
MPTTPATAARRNIDGLRLQLRRRRRHLGSVWRKDRPTPTRPTSARSRARTNSAGASRAASSCWTTGSLKPPTPAARSLGPAAPSPTPRHHSVARGNSFAAALLGLTGSYSQVDPVLRDEDPRVAARLVLPRPLAGQPQPHPQPRRALRVLPADQPRRPRHRALGSQHQHRLLRRHRQHAPQQRHHGESKKLFAPRIGFAYRMGDNNVIRAGYGITFDPVPFGRPLRGLYPATSPAWVHPGQHLRLVQHIDQGIPDVPTPDISSGQLHPADNINMGPRSPWGGLLNRGYIQSWNCTLERRCPGRWSVRWATSPPAPSAS